MYAPDLPGLRIEGEDLDDAMANATEAVAIYVEVLREDGEPLDSGGFSAEDASAALAVIDDIGTVLHPQFDQARSIELAVELQGHSACLSLTEGLDAEHWTLDGALARNAAGRGRLTLID